MFHIASYTKEDQLKMIKDCNTLTEAKEEAEVNSKDDEVATFNIFSKIWKTTHLCGNVRKDGSIDWVTTPG